MAAIVFVCALAALPPRPARAQDEGPPPPADTTTVDPNSQILINNIAGEFTPSQGFAIIKTAKGSLNISGYALFRYVNQLPAEQTFTDHLGRTKPVKTRNDLNSHRQMLWVSGFLGVPQFRYTITVWSLPTTQQTLVFSHLNYTTSRKLIFGAGITPTLTCRSMQGSWPFWAATDRQMSEEFFRGGFSSGFYVTGEPFSRFNYTASVNTNLSQLGITASNDSRDFAYTGSVVWRPTTGEFGARGGLADFENHRQLATRFGASGGHAREYRAAALGQSPNETQLKISDGLLLFEAGALADGVTVINADYDMLSVDAGMKYHGFSMQGEAFYRQLSNFNADAFLPVNSIIDRGFMVQASHMVIPRKLNVYATTGYLWDEFKRNPWEISGGASLFPFESRLWRLNLHLINVDKCPTSSTFGYYASGQTGTTVSLATDILF
jgi:hypothetical protein